MQNTMGAGPRGGCWSRGEGGVGRGEGVQQGGTYCDLDFAQLIEEDVGRLEVIVDDAA